jgi:hypothetical protein
MMTLALNICSAEHEEICYIGNRCPVCPIVERLNEFEDEMAELKGQWKDHRCEA